MADLSVVMEKLHGFETATDLYEYLRDYGIKARPMDARACAITKFVMEEARPTYRISTTKQALIARDWDDSVKDIIPHTEAIKIFINRFDNGWYKDLVYDDLR